MNGLGLEFASRCQASERKRGDNPSSIFQGKLTFVLAMFVLFVYMFCMRMTKRTGKIKQAKAATPPAQNIKPKPSDGAQVVQLEDFEEK